MICKECGNIFELPGTDYYSHSDCCPFCGSDEIAEEDLCGNGGCTMPRASDELLCDDCKNALAEKFSAFVKSLTFSEQEQVNAWLDGNYLLDAIDAIREEIKKNV